jgi:subtilisin family serine protease
VAVEVTAAARQRLEASPDVVTIEPDRQLEASGDSAPPPAAATAQESLPVATGAGWTVAVLDTGVDTNHPYVAGRTGPGIDGQGDGGACFASDCPSGPTGVASAPPCAIAGCDPAHVAGIAV